MFGRNGDQTTRKRKNYYKKTEKKIMKQFVFHTKERKQKEKQKEKKNILFSIAKLDAFYW
jgi:hypothetical protein